MENTGTFFPRGKKKAGLFAFFLLLYVLVNATVSLRMGLHWDEMLDVDGCNTGEYVAAGRWGLALYRMLFGTGAFPLLASLVGGLYICAALVWQVDLLRLRGRFLPLFYGGIYLSSVQWAYQLEYSHQCDAVALGALLCTAGAACLERGRRWAGVLLLMPAIGMYQSLALYAAALLLSLRLSSGDLSPRALFRPVVCLLAACCGYALINTFALRLPCIDAADICFQRTYQTGMSRWSEFPTDADLHGQLYFLWYYGSRFAKMTLKNMLGMAYAGQWVFASVLLPLGGLLFAGWRERKPLHALALLFLWLLPFCLILPALSDQGPRVSMAEPLTLAALWGIFLRGADLRPKIKGALALFLCFALLKSAYHVADMAVQEAYIYRTNLACLREMHARACASAESQGVGPASILLVGEAPFDPEMTWWRRDRMVAGRGYIPPAMLFRYCRFMQISDMRYASPQEAAAYRSTHDAMPTWPASGSVRCEGGVVLIRVD